MPGSNNFEVIPSMKRVREGRNDSGMFTVWVEKDNNGFWIKVVDQVYEAHWFAIGKKSSSLPPPYQCSDAIDNDGDGKIDFPADLGCSSGTDSNETDQRFPVNITFSKTCNSFTFAISGESGSREDNLANALDGRGRIINTTGNITYNNSGNSYDVDISITWGFFCISDVSGTAFTR